MDRWEASVRSALMSRVRGKNTRPELTVRSLAHRLGFRFRLHRADLPGKPDLVFPRLRRVVFVHGCFWHQHPGCRRSARPTSRVDFWNKKLSKNAARDKGNIEKLTQLGWKVLIVWECEARKPDTVARKLLVFLGN